MPLPDVAQGDPHVAAHNAERGLINDLQDLSDSTFLAALAARDARNILDFGVFRGTSSSQTVAIKAALDAHPEEAFYFPPGNYRLDTGLVVSANNSLVLAPGARIYAGAAMTTLIDYDNGAGSASNYAQDKCLVGKGMIDANLFAQKALAIGSVIRMSLGEGLTIKNPINRGIYLKAAGAEVIGRDIRLHNTGTTNVSDNVAIEADMGDCQFTDIIIRDFTVGVWDKSSNLWDKVHPWLGTLTQLTARYPTSVAFLLAGNSVLVNPYADTYRYSYRTAAASGYAKARLISPRVYINSGNLSDALAAANPGAVFDLTDGGQVFSTNGMFHGHGVTPLVFAQGSTIRLTVSDNVETAAGSVTGVSEYKRGVKLGTFVYTPNVFGSTAGGIKSSSPTPSFTGRMEVRDGTVEYLFIITGTLTADIAGRLRVGGLPLPTGAVSTGVGTGPVTYSKGADLNGAIGANGTATPLVAFLTRSVGGVASEPESASLANVAIEIWGRITCSFTYPS